MDSFVHETPRKTPLYDRHIALGGKMVDFGGWSLPVQYGSILEEHFAVRRKVGLFDVSHMGEIEISGPGAGGFLNNLLTADLSRLSPERAVYSPMCYPNGCVVDDLIVYQLAADRYLLVVNAGCKDRDFNWINEQAKGSVAVSDRSDEFAQIALQGPDAAILIGLLPELVPAQALKFFQYQMIEWTSGDPIIVSRTGYTGEDGFEFYGSPDMIVTLFDRLIAAGAVPCGLGARDSLRFEAALPLYGHELSATITPLEAGLGRFVALGKKSFIGSDALINKPVRRLIGLKIDGRAIPRSDYIVHQNGKPVGNVTSGMFAPTIGCGCALALVHADGDPDNGNYTIVIRDREESASMVSLPFYRRERK
jgi:aminomethyltransferase